MTKEQATRSSDGLRNDTLRPANANDRAAQRRPKRPLCSRRKSNCQPRLTPPRRWDRSATL